MQSVGDGNNILIICLYVDDLLFTWNGEEMVQEFKQEMFQEFKMGRRTVDLCPIFLASKYIKKLMEFSYLREVC